jgi:hypothetical protein
MDFIAYIDPGAGSIALQAIVGLGLGVALTLRDRIARLVNKIRRSDSSATEEKQ